MKTLNNKPTNMTTGTLNLDDEDRVKMNVKANYKDLIEHCINIIPQGGYTDKDIMERIRIRSILKLQDDNMKFEDADQANLEKLVSTARWLTLSEDIPAFKEAVATMEEAK